MRTFLEQSGMLEDGTDEAIATLKAKYWKEYRRLYKTAYRKKHRHILTTLSQSLYADASARVDQLALTIPQYVRKLIAEDTKGGVSLGVSDAKLMAQTISRIYSEVQNLVRNHISHTDVPPYLYDELLSRIEYLEAVVLKQG